MKIHDTHTVGGYCAVKPEQRRDFGPEIDSARLGAIIRHDKKWANGTRLHYYFFDSDEDQKNVVREAFAIWESIGLGLTFKEVASRDEAEIRIGFVSGDGAWSYVGRDVLTRSKNARTMNFGWSLTGQDGLDTALHEIGHTLAMPHEHQNPLAGIVWDEEAVYAELAGPPNFWSREKTFHNIIRKINPEAVIGTEWDQDSVMHYPFPAGLIHRPAEFRDRPLVPAAGLSPRDKSWVKQVYPPIEDQDITRMKVFAPERLGLEAGEQFNAIFVPEETRRYTIQTFGSTDMVLTIFEDVDGEPAFLAGDDDSGFDWNARIQIRLRKGRTYHVRARLFFDWSSGPSAVMIH